MEVILDDLARRGFIVFPFAGFFGQSSNYPRDPADQKHYVRHMLARLAAYPNVMWNTAGPEPNVGNVWMASEEVERLGRLIGNGSRATSSPSTINGDVRTAIRTGQPTAFSRTNGRARRPQPRSAEESPSIQTAACPGDSVVGQYVPPQRSRRLF
jgi:hypothetical protein